MIMRKLIALLFRQYGIGNWWGAFKNVAAGSSMYVTIINLVLIAVTAYGTTIAPWLQGQGLNIPFITFFGVLFMIVLIIFAFEYKLSIPSQFSFWNDQWWRHNNPIKRKMDKMDKKLKAIGKMDKRLKGIEEALKRIEGK